MEISIGAERQAFSRWLRTGLWPGDPDVGAVEVKFNPYHDPRNGQFTFAPGGPRSLSRVIIAHRRQTARSKARSDERAPRSAGERTGGARQTANVPDGETAARADAVYRPGETHANYALASSSRQPRRGRGSNSGAFHDPMTLEQAFPGLNNSPAGAIVAAGEALFDLGGPARAATTALAQNWTNQLIDQIKALEPGFRYDSIGFPQTLQGQINQLNDLRWLRATAFMRKGELRPLQVETVRFIQQSADRAYAEGVELQRAGKLKMRLSPQEALGNYVDAQVRRDLRRRFRTYGIEAAGSGPVRVNRRENNSAESSYRRPDARVGDIAYDVTLTQKTLETAQVRGFFATDFSPSNVIIIRPRQVGERATYAVKRPEAKR